jgi:hypothetical protein
VRVNPRTHVYSFQRRIIVDTADSELLEASQNGVTMQSVLLQ